MADRTSNRNQNRSQSVQIEHRSQAAGRTSRNAGGASNVAQPERRRQTTQQQSAQSEGRRQTPQRQSAQSEGRRLASQRQAVQPERRRQMTQAEQLERRRQNGAPQPERRRQPVDDRRAVIRRAEMRKRKIQEQKLRKQRFIFSLALTLVLALLLLIFLPHMSSQKEELREQGVEAYNQGNYEEAAEKLQASLAEKQWFTRKMDLDTLLYLGNTDLELHQYQNAEAVYNELIEKNKGRYKEEYLESLLQLAQAFVAMEQEDYETAASGFQAAVDAGNVRMNQYLGACYRQLGDESAMLSCYQNYLMDYPLNLEMTGQLSDYYLETGDYETAKSYIEQGLAMEASDSDSEGRKRLYYNQIVYYEKLLDYETALEEAEHFLELFPNDEDGLREYEFLYTRININPEPVNTSESTQ